MEKPKLVFEIVDFDDEGKVFASPTEESIIQLCKYYYGIDFAGLTINKTDYNSWKKWYLTTHNVSDKSENRLKEIYSCAQYIWRNYV